MSSIESSYFHTCIGNAQRNCLKKEVSICIGKENAYKGNRDIEHVTAEILWLMFVIKHWNIFVVWNQKAGILSPLTTDGINSTNSHPGKSAPKREPGHPGLYSLAVNFASGLLYSDMWKLF